MGILDNLKNVMGKKKQSKVTAATAGPSQILRENGLDPAGLKFTFGADGSVTVKGAIKQESERQKIISVLEGMEGVGNVIDQMAVAAPAPKTGPESGVAPASGQTEQPAAGPARGGNTTYTVQSGDTLWSIAKKHYGEGSKYMEIFEANKGLLKDPDHIYPGQELVIPPKQD